jgi:GxxExxY protein
LVLRPDELNGLAKRALDAAFSVHSALGPGLLESAYCACLIHELRCDGLSVQNEYRCRLFIGV